MAEVLVPVEFHVEHLRLFQPRAQDAEGIFSIPGFFERAEMYQTASKEAGTFLHAGRILFCAGHIELWPGVAQVWMFPSVYVPEQPMDFCKTLKYYIDQIIHDHDYHRVETTSPEDDFHTRWMEWLGFEKEGVMRQYSNTRTDYGMYARVQP